jgi:hypothetical protein
MRIARAGKVYQPNANPFEIAKASGKIRHTLAGINSATTFTGFCSPHDSELFRPIDDDNLVPTKEQCFLFHYRALCRELYVKRTTVPTNNLLRTVDRGKSPRIQQIVQGMVSARDSAIRDAIGRMEADKSTCDRAFLARDYGGVSGCVLAFRQVPTVACSGLTQPTYDFSGGTLQNIADMSKPLWNLSFTLLPNVAGGIAAIVWLQGADLVSRRFVSSLLGVPDDRKSDVLVQFVLDSFENHVIQPDWWEGLTEDLRAELEERALNWADIRPINNRALVPGDRRFADWGFQSANLI